MNVLGINAVFHDPSAALVIDGEIIAAAEEERFSRRKHGKEAVPFSTWEMPEHAASWCLRFAGIDARDLDGIAFSYDPDLAMVGSHDLMGGTWEGLRTLYVEHAPNFLKTILPGLPLERFRFVPHHVAHAASAYLAAPYERCAVLVADGRGECWSYFAGVARDRCLEAFATQDLPHSLGLLYERVTMHLGFKRASDEYKVMGLAAHGTPRHVDAFREAIRVTGDGRFTIDEPDLERFAPARTEQDAMLPAHADLAASMQVRLEEVLLELARWLHGRTGERDLVMAGGVALNCVANARIAVEGPFERVWVQPAAGDAGTSLGAALYLANELGDTPRPMTTAALGPGWSDAEIARELSTAGVAYEHAPRVVEDVAETIAANGIVAWFQGRSEFGPRALGHRSLLANPRYAENLERLNDIKGREQFRPVAPMVLASKAAQIFEGPLPSPYMLFTHRVRPEWRERIAAVVHVDGSARIQTVDHETEPLVADMLEAVERATATPVVVNTSLNTAGRPMVDSPRDALELFGSSPVDLLAIGPFVVRRASAYRPVVVSA